VWELGDDAIVAALNARIRARADAR